MSFLRAARAARAGRSGPQIILSVMAMVLSGIFISCGSSSHSSSVPNHSAYVTLPASGSVALLHINGATGAISIGAQTPQTQGTTPKGLALLPSKKFLYAANSFADTISIFNVGSDGSLTLSGTPTPAGSGPDAAVIDPSGKYLLVTNSFSNDISVFSIDASTGALSQVGSTVPANTDPSEILITPSGKFVYVTNPGQGTVTAFTFSNGVLGLVPNTPIFSGLGAIGLEVDSSGRFLYVANAAAPNSSVPSQENISGFNIDPNTGALTPILGSPFTSSNGSGPQPLTAH